VTTNGSFAVNNETLGVDPAPGVVKHFAAFWRKFDRAKGGPAICARATEGETLHFDLEIHWISYQNACNFALGARHFLLDHPDVYRDVLNSWRLDRDRNWFEQKFATISFPINNQSLGGDPFPGLNKICYMRVENHDKHLVRENWHRWTAVAREGAIINIEAQSARNGVKQDISDDLNKDWTDGLGAMP